MCRFKLQECMGKLSELGFSWHLAERAARGAGADAGLAAQLLLDGMGPVLCCDWPSAAGRDAVCPNMQHGMFKLSVQMSERRCVLMLGCQRRRRLQWIYLGKVM